MKNYTLFPIQPLIDRVTIYHDETTIDPGKNLRGHGLLFVPQRKLHDLLKALQEVRDKTKSDSNFILQIYLRVFTVLNLNVLESG